MGRRLLRLAASAALRCLPGFLLAVLLRQLQRVHRSRQCNGMRRALKECHRLTGPSPVACGEAASALAKELRREEQADEEQRERGIGSERPGTPRVFLLSTEGKMRLFLEVLEAVRLQLGGGHVGADRALSGEEMRRRDRRKESDVQQQVMQEMALGVEAQRPEDIDLVQLERMEHVLEWLLDREAKTVCRLVPRGLRCVFPV